MPIRFVISKGNVPVKIWADKEEVESKAIDQLVNTATLPFVFKHVAVMPDVHSGIGATIGSVVATQGAVCPAAVGVDIGCGMQAVKTFIHSDSLIDLHEIRQKIEDLIPVGFSGNATISDSVKKWFGWKTAPGIPYLGKREYNNELIGRAQAQMGTLGGGNHFIEICVDSTQGVWIMLHSGSRNVGKTLAERYIDEAKGIMKKMFIKLPDPDLAYLVEGTEEFTEYIKALLWCQDYARANRDEMMGRIKSIFADMFPERHQEGTLFAEPIDCHHNFVAKENHFGKNVLVTRKGAVRARQGDVCIIPGSMGAKSYIARGLGNAESFNSCSHGAGRAMSRGEAKRKFTIEDLSTQTSGVECRKDAGVLDEIPSAYKDIQKVMDNQNDLVEIQEELKQILVVKG